MTALASNVTMLETAYLNHFKEAGEFENLYAKFVIANLEDGKSKLWFSTFLKIIDAIAQNSFFSEGDWEEKLLGLRRIVQQNAAHTEGPIGDVTAKELSDLREFATESIKKEKLEQVDAKIIRAALELDFFKNIVKNYHPDKEEVEKYFAESIPKGFPEKTKQIIKETSELEPWLIRLAKITLSAQERINYLTRMKSVPRVVLQELSPNRFKIAGSESLRSLSPAEFNSLISSLKRHYIEKNAETQEKATEGKV